MSVKVSSKYQVVIPESVRDQLDIKPGQEVEVIAKNGIVYLVPVQPLSQIKDTIKKYGNITADKLRDKKDRIK